MKRTEINVTTGEVLEIEMTAEEISIWEATQSEAQAAMEALKAEQEAKATAKASALAKLTALGLTPEEAAAL
jgi:hypothetical protein